MMVNKQCACGQNVEFEAADLTCPTCGRSLREQFAPSPPPRFEKTPPTRQANTYLPSADTHETLAAVRAVTCYGTLRGLINGVFWIGMVLAALVAIGEIFVASQRKSSDLTQADLIVFGACFLSALFLVALRQAMLLGIDAADVLIADRTDRLADRAEQLSRDGDAATVDK